MANTTADESVTTGISRLQGPWFYFIRNDDGTSAECKTCKKSVQTKNGTTSGLHYHLSTHKIEARKRKRAYTSSDLAVGRPNQPSPKKANLGAELAQEQTLHAIISRMAAKSGLPFRLFESDEDLRLCIQARLDQLHQDEVIPKVDKTFKSYTMEYCGRVRTAVKKSFQLMQEKGIKFSLCFDEWTSVANKRYINICVFAPNKMCWSLGLVKITGSATADRIMELIMERLYEFAIDYNDSVVSITTDGAATMIKLGTEESDAQHQVCLVHAIQLAVLDVLYVKKKRSSNSSVAEIPIDDESENFLDVEGIECNEGFDTVENETVADFHDSSVKAIIFKIRKIGSHFHRSAIHNETLQSYVKQKFNDPELSLKLLIDCKTRWNSLYDMLDRYWRIKECVDKALIDIKSKEVITSKEKYIISCILTALRPVKTIVTSLSCRDSNLMIARRLIILMFQQLKKRPNRLSTKLLGRLYVRLQSRWNTNAGVLAYLATGSYNSVIPPENRDESSDDKMYDYVYEEHAQCVFSFEELDVEEVDAATNCFKMFEIPDKRSIKAHLLKLIAKLYSQEAASVAEPNAQPVNPATNVCKSFEDLCKEAMLQDDDQTNVEIPDSNKIAATLLVEMNHLEKTKTRIGFVKKCYEGLMTIKPSSVESERAFSLSAYICTKVRSRLNDSTLDSLCFLRSFFRNPCLFSDD